VLKTQTQKNVIANFGGSAWVAFIGFAFIPFYLKKIGIEGYGLIGFQTTLMATIAILDLGFGSAGAREMALLSSTTNFRLRAKTLLKSLEFLYWILAILVGGVFYFLSPFVVERWLNLGALEQSVAIASVQMMAIALVFQFPVSLYSGCLMGLMHQVPLNVFNIVFSTLRYAGAALVVWLTDGSLYSFFLWQLFVAILNVFSLRVYLGSKLRTEEKASFQIKEVKSIAKFALSMSAINLLSLLLHQMDKIVLSKLLSLEQFGYYMLAWTVAGALYRISTPVYNAIYPRLTQLYSQKNEETLAIFYHKSCQLMALVIVPLSLFIAVFSYEVVGIWTRDLLVAEKVRWTVALLTLGSMVNGLIYVPYGLQLASGWTSLSLKLTLLSLAVFFPMVVYLATYWQDAALAWLLLNLMTASLGAFFMYKRILKNEKYAWLKNSIIAPILSSGVFFLLIKATKVTEMHLNIYVNFCLLALVGFLGFLFTLLSMPETRKVVVSFFLKEHKHT